KSSTCPRRDSIATAAALGRQSRSPSLQPLSPANARNWPYAAAAAASAKRPRGLHAYIMDMDLNGRLAELRKTYDKDFDRLKRIPAGSARDGVQLHEPSARSDHSAAAVLCSHWPAAYKRDASTRLGLHFVPDCIALYKSLLASLRGPSLEEFRNSACLLEQFGERLLAWYTADDHTSNINEDDIILKLISLRPPDNQDFNGFFSRAEAHPVMNKRRFVDLYSVNMLQADYANGHLLDAADAENLEACLSIAKDISDLQQQHRSQAERALSRQLVLSKSFSNFWEKSMMDESQVHRFQKPDLHLHTCRLYLTREAAHARLGQLPLLRLFVFTEFLFVISPSLTRIELLNISCLNILTFLRTAGVRVKPLMPGISGQPRRGPGCRSWQRRPAVRLADRFASLQCIRKLCFCLSRLSPPPLPQLRLPTPAASTEATRRRHRRANSHAGMAHCCRRCGCRAASAPSSSSMQEQELDEQQQPAARPEVEESSDSSSRIADTGAVFCANSVENFQRQSELMREQRVCLTQIVAECPTMFYTYEAVFVPERLISYSLVSYYK
uniref:F-box domain-containing protein n=1 Tax=Macrostomum lignano TaxID=282301 RepID=A0A1I8FQQ9_9PLAT